ncbi:MAG TPA: hypothetical protein VH986_01955 [Acidimicrobiia bacterium]
MSAFTCSQLREVAPELALGVLGGAERAEAVMHVNGCARCQALVNEYAEVADAIPLLAPEMEPPPGFEGRVLTAGRENRRRRARRWVASLAVAAAAAAILSITIVRVVESGSDVGNPVLRAVPAEAHMVVETSAHPAGWAYVTNGHSVAIAVDYGLPSGRYAVSVDPVHGSSATIGTMSVVDGRGSWTGHSDVPLETGSTIALVGSDGARACHGTVAAPE